MIDDVRAALRVTTTETDAEIEMLIEAAMDDMIRVGIKPSYLGFSNSETFELNESPAIVRHAVICYCKAHYGFDNPEAERFDASYRRIVCDILNSSNVLAADEDA